MSQMLTSQQQSEMIDLVCEITKKTPDQVKALLKQNKWDQEKAIDFLLNAGDFIQEPIIKDQINPYQANITQIENKSIQSQILEMERQLQSIEKLEWETNEIKQAKRQMLNRSLKKNSYFNYQIRIYQNPVGLVNVGQKGYFNCILQILAQNPSILEKVLSFSTESQSQNIGDSRIQFINELQLILRQLIFTNKRFLNHEKLLKLTNETIKMNGFSDQNLEPAEFLQYFVKTLDVTLCNGEYDNSKQQGFQDISLGVQFQINNGITMNFQREDRFLYFSLLKLVCQQDQFTQFINLPKTFSMSLKSTNQSEFDYYFPFQINLDFLVKEHQFKELKITLQTAVNDDKINDINKKLKTLNWLTVVEDSYEQDDITPINVLESLRQEKQKLQNDLGKEFLENSKLIKGEQNNQYYLQAVVIEINQENSKHFYAYIYNFYLKQWFRFNDTDVRKESEETVKRDSQQNGCLLVYINQNLMESTKQNQEKQMQIAAKLTLSQGNINWQELEKENLIIPSIQKEMKNLLQRENEKLQNQINK